MGGRLDWVALPVVVDMLEVDDPEQLIEDLIVFRDHVNNLAKVRG